MISHPTNTQDPRRNKVLFITSSRLGDAILASSLLHFLVQEKSPLDLTVACGPLPAPLFEAIPGLTDLVPFSKEPYNQHWFKLWRRCHKTSWDWIIDNRGSMISYFLSAKKRNVWKKQNTASHRVQQMAEWLELPRPYAPKIWVPETYRTQVQRLLPYPGPFLAMAPAANWIGKQWPYFKELIQVCLSTLFPKPKILLFCAPHEQKALQPLVDHQSVFLITDVPLLITAAYLESCALFVGNDSGLMHLAAAMETPTLGLFGPSDEKAYAPWGPKGHVIRTPFSLQEMRQQPGFSFQANHTYMDGLRVETVFTAVQKLW
jgi:heptosyltransferase-3